MKLKKALALVLSVALLLGTLPTTTSAQVAAGFQALAEVEQLLYGNVGTGAIQPRLERVELDLFGRVQTGALTIRVQELARLVLNSDPRQVSILLQLNSMEWMIYDEIKPDASIIQRVAAIERDLYGEERKELNLGQRLDALLHDIWPGGNLTVAKGELAEGTVIQIALLTKIDSSAMKVGDEVQYVVVNSVVRDNKVLIPAGARGVGRVTDVRPSSRLGRDGHVEVNWGTLRAIDGTEVPVRIGQRAEERTNSLELATGAALAGVILLGPIGLAAGALVTGQDDIVPVGTQLFIEVSAPVEINGLSLVPAY